MEKIKHFSLVALIFCMMGLIIQTTRYKSRIDETKDLIAPPPQIERYSAGFNYQIADLVWIRSLQDFDYCEVKLAQNLCKGNSWLSKMLLSIVALDPHYEVVYQDGALALTVLVSDYPGATQLFDLGVPKFPKNWRLVYSAAYHAAFEEKNYGKAGLLYKLAADNGGPVWGYALAARLLTKEGQIEIAEKLIADLEKAEKSAVVDEYLIKRMRERIEEAKRETNK